MILVGAGIVQAWYFRYLIYSDGIPYLEIARYYLAGDWKAALNSYWSPLYSWVLAILMVIFRPAPSWETALAHLANFLSYLGCLIGFELLLSGLLELQKRRNQNMTISEPAFRVTGYCVFLMSTLGYIGMGHVSPDMLGTAITLFLAAILLRIESANTTSWTYIWFGILLSLEYLARSAFAVFIPVYLLVAGALLYGRTQRLSSLKPVAFSATAALIIVAPFLVALGTSKARFTLGDAGKCNYGWEIDGAARLVHWQGEPGDIGQPAHPTRKVFNQPAVYTFASPEPGSYPPWYEPSYWYAGITPHLKLHQQVYVAKRGIKGALYLFVRSPIVIPACALILLAGWSNWLSKRGILAYWFLLLPAIAYIGVFTLVYLDPRYVAGNLLIVWMCLLASVSVTGPRQRTAASTCLILISLVFVGFFLKSHELQAIRFTLKTLLHPSEAEWNLNGMIAQGMKEAGLRPGDRIAWIGEAINAEWVTLDGAKIVAEVPVRYDRIEEHMFRLVFVNRANIKTFWYAPPSVKEKIFDLFRKEGAKFVIVDRVPEGADATGWQRVLPKDAPHLPWSGGQIEYYRDIAYMRLEPR